jgi:Domain of unknown function (DUF4386)
VTAGTPELATLRRTGSAICLLTGPAALLLAELVDPVQVDDPQEVLDAVADHSTRFAVATWAQLAAVLLLLPTLVAFLHLLRERGSALGHAAYGLVNLALIGYAVDFGRRSAIDELAQGGVDQADIGFLMRLDDNPLYAVTDYLLVVGLAGLALLGWAFWRARLFHRAVPLLLVAAAVCAIAPIHDAIGAALLTAAFAIAGVQLLQMSDDRWGRVYEGPPRT